MLGNHYFNTLFTTISNMFHAVASYRQRTEAAMNSHLIISIKWCKSSVLFTYRHVYVFAPTTAVKRQFDYALQICSISVLHLINLMAHSHQLSGYTALDVAQSAPLLISGAVRINTPAGTCGGFL